MTSNRHRRNEIESLSHLKQMLSQGQSLLNQVFQGIDLRGLKDLEKADLNGCLLLGCTFDSGEQEDRLRAQGAQIFPEIEGLPYDPYRTGLYTVDELMKGYKSGGYVATRDFKIYAHSHKAKHHPGGASIRETLAQRIHDHSIDDALKEFLLEHQGNGAVGIMGGHGTKRSDPMFAKVAQLTWSLTRAGYLVVTGGGPGMMEAGNLGAWFAPHDDPQVLTQAIDELSQADTFSGGHQEGSQEFSDAVSQYISSAAQVVEKYSPSDKKPGLSLAVPTWFYGHEPSNLFSLAIAKYFDNSIREEGLLALAEAGVVYAPGSAGTMQEIFQDLTQNHYATYASRSPMVLFGAQRYQAEYQLISNFIEQREMASVYGDMVVLLDQVDQVVQFIKDHPMRDVPKPPPLYERLAHKS